MSDFPRSYKEACEQACAWCKAGLLRTNGVIPRHQATLDPLYTQLSSEMRAKWPREEGGEPCPYVRCKAPSREVYEASLAARIDKLEAQPIKDLESVEHLKKLLIVQLSAWMNLVEDRDAMKHENRHLTERVDELEAQIEALKK